MKLDTLRQPILGAGIFLAFALCGMPASSGPHEGEMKQSIQYKAPNGQIISTVVAPDQVKIVSRKENLSAVCVEIASIGKVWAIPALWMVNSAGGNVRQPVPGGRLAGAGNGFGSFREIPVDSRCE
jgi:hypothetical protein